MVLHWALSSADWEYLLACCPPPLRIAYAAQHMPRVFTGNLKIKICMNVFSGAGNQNRVGISVFLFSLEIGISHRNLWKCYPTRNLPAETQVKWDR